MIELSMITTISQIQFLQQQRLSILYMDFITKRQKFANEKRRKHREQIFKKHRNLEALRNQQFINAENNSNSAQQNMGIESEGDTRKMNKKSQFVFQSQFLGLDCFNFDQIDRRIKNGQIQTILSIMPKWIAGLPLIIDKGESFYQDNKSLLSTLINLSKYCLKNSRLIQPITNCLVELTGLSTQFLGMLGISQHLLCEQFIFSVFNILKQASNMQIIFNCVYICGNLHQSLVNAGQNIDLRNQIEQMQISIIAKMEDICSKYPNYDNCLQIMLWYMKNCLVINKNKQHHKKQLDSNNHMLQLYSVNIIHRSIVSLCSLFVTQKSNDSKVELQKVMMNKQTQNYYLKMIKNSLKILYILLSDSSIYYPDSQTKVSSINMQKILSLVDEIFSIVLSNFMAPNGRLNKVIMEGMSEIMWEILFYLPNIPHYLPLIPPSILNACDLTSQGLIQSAESFSVCRKVFNICLQNNVIKIQRMIVRNFLINCKKILCNQIMVGDREYRIKIIELFVEFQDNISHGQVKDIILKDIISCSDANKTALHEDSFTKLTEGNLLQKKYQIYLLQNVIPYVLNALELLLIDSDTQNRTMGIRSILKLTVNWQISTQMMRNMIMSMGMERIIIEMQSETEQEIYNAALDLIEELKLDEGE